MTAYKKALKLELSERPIKFLEKLAGAGGAGSAGGLARGGEAGGARGADNLDGGGQWAGRERRETSEERRETEDLSTGYSHPPTRTT